MEEQINTPYIEPKKKVKKTKVIFWVMLILLILAAGYIFNKEYIEPKSIRYAEQGAMQIINEINTKGNIPVINNETITWVSINQLCGR